MQVSDRQFRVTYNSDNAADLQRADAMIADGHGDDILKREAGLGGAPITANRFHSLAAAGGDDDMFSSDLSDADLKVPAARLSCSAACILVPGSRVTCSKVCSTAGPPMWWRAKVQVGGGCQLAGLV